VILTRELFLGHFDVANIAVVILSTSVYAAAAVAVAAKLFGQESVQFADSASIKTVFLRKFFKPAAVPTVAQALLLLAVIYPLNFFVQQRLGQTPGLVESERFYWAFAATLIVLLVVLPWVAARYMRVNVRTAFGLTRPPLLALLAALCIGCSTWVLPPVWFAFQEQWLPMPPQMQQIAEYMNSWLAESHVLVVVLLLAAVPALCEELFFRGYVLSGVRSTLGKMPAVLLVAVVFAVFHQSIFRFFFTALLGILLGLLVVRWRSVWPAVLAHFMHNAISISSTREDGLLPLLDRLGYADADGMPTAGWLIGACVLLLIGVLLCLLAPARPEPGARSRAVALQQDTPARSEPSRP
jgi:ABC-2 type transport system permease protein/sodium transport system permease protein